MASERLREGPPHQGTPLRDRYLEFSSSTALLQETSRVRACAKKKHTRPKCQQFTLGYVRKSHIH